MHHHEVLDYQQNFSMSVSSKSSMASPDSAFLSPNIEFNFPCLPKFCPINKSRKFIYSPMVFTAHRGKSHITLNCRESCWQSVLILLGLQLYILLFLQFYFWNLHSYILILGIITLIYDGQKVCFKVRKWKYFKT